MDTAYLQERITAVKAQIEATEGAILALAAPGVQEYVIDTGQTKTRVTKFDIGRLNKTVDVLMNRLVVLQARMTGSGTTNVRPSW